MKENYDDIFNINPKVQTSVGFLLGLLLIGDLNANEQNVVGNWIILVGQTILSNAASQIVVETRIKQNSIYNINSKEFKKKCNPLVYDINMLREVIQSHNPNCLEDLVILEKVLNDLGNKITQLKKTTLE